MRTRYTDRNPTDGAWNHYSVILSSFWGHSHGTGYWGNIVINQLNCKSLLFLTFHKQTCSRFARLVGWLFVRNARYKSQGSEGIENDIHQYRIWRCSRKLYGDESHNSKGTTGCKLVPTSFRCRSRFAQTASLYMRTRIVGVIWSFSGKIKDLRAREIQRTISTTASGDL